jgi:hypothetical protein
VIYTVFFSIIMRSLSSDQIFILLVIRFVIGIIFANFNRSGAISKNRSRPNDWYVFGFLFPFLTLFAVCFVKDKSTVVQAEKEVENQKASFDIGNQNSSVAAPKSFAQSNANVQRNSNRCEDCNSLMAPTMETCPKCKTKRSMVVPTTT